MFVILADSFARLGEKTTVMSPEVLAAAGVPCCRYRVLPLGLVRKYVDTMHLWNSHLVQVCCFQVVILTELSGLCLGCSVDEILCKMDDCFSAGVKLRVIIMTCRLVQNAGEYVVTFPRAYHLGFSHGLCLPVSMLCYLVLGSWV